MKKSRVLISAATLAGACMIGASLTGFAAVDSATANAEKAVAAVQEVAPGAVSDVPELGRADSATAVHVATPDGGSVYVPKDPSRGVKVTTPGSLENMTIGLPFAAKAGHATSSQETGVVVYDNHNGSSTVPVPHTDGSVQISTVIDNANAPKRYDYPIQAPKGASLMRSAKGVVAVVQSDGSPITVFGDAWAKDAHGNPVPTHYEVKKNTLTQVIEFTAQTAFPVVADPQTTGVYSYNCVLQNGSSYFMKPGELLSNCKGSRLQKYINGRMVQTIALTGYGRPGNPAAFGTLDCVIAILGAGASIYGIGGAVVLSVQGFVAWVGLGTSVYGLKSCRG